MIIWKIDNYFPKSGFRLQQISVSTYQTTESLLTPLNIKAKQPHKWQSCRVTAKVGKTVNGQGNLEQSGYVTSGSSENEGMGSPAGRRSGRWEWLVIVLVFGH